jgi:hypothetical protein
MLARAASLQEVIAQLRAVLMEFVIQNVTASGLSAVTVLFKILQKLVSLRVLETVRPIASCQRVLTVL